MAREVAFLFIGGPHQVFHLAPVAAALSRMRPDLAVVCLYDGARTAGLLERVRADAVAPRMRIEPVPEPGIARLLHRVTGRWSVRKGPLLLALAWRLRGAAAVATAERTSAALRTLGLRAPLIQFRHGAGDRAPASERRLKAFDLIVLPGEKDRRRAIETIGIAPDRLRIAGYVKLDHLDDLRRPVRRPFDNDRPTILYNPHFDATLSSWPIAEDIVAAFAAQDRFNLVVAPHIRIALDLDASARARWQAMAVPDRIVVDLDSDRLIDMSYTLGCNAYLGDVSSQLYEFLIRPRPVAFVNHHGVAWQRDPRYAGWHLGVVATGADDVLATIARAIARQPERIEPQRVATEHAFGTYRGAAERGAAHIAELLPLRPKSAALRNHERSPYSTGADPADEDAQ